MSTKLINHALSTPNLLPGTIGEALLLLSAAPAGPALDFLQGDGKRWTSDIEVRRTYIDLLQGSGLYPELKGFCEDEVDQGADDWKVVKGWTDGHLGVLQSDPSTMYFGIDDFLICRESIKLLQAKLDKRFSNRNFALGSIYLSANLPNDFESGIPSAREQCTRYFDQYGRKNACFTDIQSYVAILSKEDQTQFLQGIATKSNTNEVPFSSVLI